MRNGCNLATLALLLLQEPCISSWCDNDAQCPDEQSCLLSLGRSRTCGTCSERCTRCDGQDDSRCIKCKKQNYLDVLGETGEDLPRDVGRCLPCQESCAECISIDICTACKDSRFLDGFFSGRCLENASELHLAGLLRKNSILLVSLAIALSSVPVFVVLGIWCLGGSKSRSEAEKPQIPIEPKMFGRSSKDRQPKEEPDDGEEEELELLEKAQ
eukprot:TRINITY_DN638_c5_g1_i1.p1 TRINITY_DN638_c5_g1~~TRINITY_DN638_c5_g1_i1.p1  ORF type:complete len:214 (+),score=21.28 TRINITY_DN638_c5_g1_i1:21-662(+)